MNLERASGILLHPTSLPGRYGIGDLGGAARRFLDFLVRAEQSLWQVLPLGPTGHGDSPYQCFSAFAGNPLLVSPEELVADGLLTGDDLRDAPAFPDDRVDYGAVIPYRHALLARAAERFRAADGHPLHAELDRFVRAQQHWLDDFALFMALKEAHGGATWSAWPRPLALREPAALADARKQLAGSIFKHKFIQFAFFRQWTALRREANRRGIRMIGDIPIFVAYDSADVWAHPDLFFLDERGRPTVVAGVPPDYFSATGQLWGNPLYRWERMAEQGYAWWLDRLRAMFAQVDILRIDHFIGIHRYWEVPARAKTAKGGRYRPGPGADFLQKAREALRGLPIIAEDLGAVTPEVEALRDQFELPGMKLLQFAFGGDATNPFLPHNYERRCVAYTGTHDNDTTVGWFSKAPPEQRSAAQRYFARSGEDIAYDFIRGVMGSVADTAIVPLQDVLCLGSEARMNHPGRASGNWQWRFREDAINDWHVGRLAEMATLYGRALSAREAARKKARPVRSGAAKREPAPGRAAAPGEATPDDAAEGAPGAASD